LWAQLNIILFFVDMDSPAPQHSATTTTVHDVEASSPPDTRPKSEKTPNLDQISSSFNTQEDELTYTNAPKLSLVRLFWYFFYNFGLFAWGGPVAQIALIKEQIVVKEKWITLARFQRVFAVYQILPGPEAAELCMFFGCLSAGRVGGIVAGLGFILPGFTLMLLASYLYTLAGLDNRYFNASFRALQPVVAAMVGRTDRGQLPKVANKTQVFRATHKIADHSVVKQGTKKVDPFLIIAAICTAVNSALHLNM
jgi:chromate transport protein ChrA